MTRTVVWQVHAQLRVLRISIGGVACAVFACALHDFSMIFGTLQQRGCMQGNSCAVTIHDARWMHQHRHKLHHQALVCACCASMVYIMYTFQCDCFMCA